MAIGLEEVQPCPSSCLPVMLIQPQASTVQGLERNIDVRNCCVCPAQDGTRGSDAGMSITKIFEDSEEQRRVLTLLPTTLWAFLQGIEPHCSLVDAPAVKLFPMSLQISLSMVVDVLEALLHVSTFREDRGMQSLKLNTYIKVWEPTP